MSDIDIFRQLLKGNHLEKKELERAEGLIKHLSVVIKKRVV